MKIIIAKHSGFCMGVRMAMNTILRCAHASNASIQTLGPLIHNPQTISLLNKMNVSTVNSPEDISADTVVIRTHGVPPSIKKEVENKSANIIDATCPHVLRIHRIIDEHRKNGYGILIFGDGGHAEVKGLQGYAGEVCHLIQKPDDVQNLPLIDKVCLVAQTTQDISEWLKIKREVEKKFHNAKIFDTICRATDNRQKEVERLARMSDCVIVVGGKNSANSTRLYEIAKAISPASIHVETEAELNDKSFANMKTVAVVSGASTPSWLLQRVSERLREIDLRNKTLPVRAIEKSWKYLVAFKGYLALGAASMTYSAQSLQGNTIIPLHLLITAFYIHSMYVLNRLTYIRSHQYEEIFHLDPILTYRKLAQLLLLITGLSSLALASFLDKREFIIILGSTTAGILYHVKLLPKNNLPLLRHRRLKDIPLSKDLGIGIAWGVVCTAYPFESDKYFFSLPSLNFIFAFLFVFITAFTRTLFNDLHDIQRDMVVGRDTLPILMKNTFFRFFPILPATAIASTIICAVITATWPTVTLLLLLSPIFMLVCNLLFEKGLFEDETSFNGIVDLCFILPAITLLIALYMK